MVRHAAHRGVQQRGNKPAVSVDGNDKPFTTTFPYLARRVRQSREDSRLVTAAVTYRDRAAVTSTA